jgi:hypothetical protein
VLLPAGPLPVPPLPPPLISEPSPVAAGKKRSNPTSLSDAVKTRRPLELGTPPDSLNRALDFLRDELENRAVASDAFPPEISCSHIRTSVARFEDEISAAAKRRVCCSCGKLVPNTNIYHVDNDDPLLLPLEGALDTVLAPGMVTLGISARHAMLHSIGI